MIKEFTLNETNAILNFSVKYCDTQKEILDSVGFNKVLNRYIARIIEDEGNLANFISEFPQKEVDEVLTQMFKLLLVMSVDEVSKLDSKYAYFLNDRKQLHELVEGLYGFWRHFERYGVVQSKIRANGIQNVNFIEETSTFNNLVLKLYRTILENIIGGGQRVYRQLAAGINAGLVINDMRWELPKGYECLRNIAVIDSIVLRPPFITYSKKNTRKGTYKEIDYNPLEELKLTANHWYCYPAYIGESLAYVYFHRDYMCHGVSLCNLFQLAKYEDYEAKKPDIIYVFGARKENYKEHSYFHHDKVNDIYVGVAYHTDEIDYFGYMKKMMLTLHNVRMIDKGGLPTHGAMVNITMKDGKEANIVIIGDSGAGKSESLDALSSISKDYLKEMKVIFDDMGTLKFKDGKILGYGTEIGAFVRLDDLDTGYAYREMDRAIFMNPNKVNSRLIMPNTAYEDVVKGYKVDILLYANNYMDEGSDIHFFSNKTDAINTFRLGRRRAKGTTSEEGIVESYFANPFGPVQRQEQCEVLLDQYFSKLFEDNIPVGEMYTKLAVPGAEQKGPKAAAIQLFEWIKNAK